MVLGILTHILYPLKLISLCGANILNELKTAFREANLDSTVRVIILKANGKVFSAGADLGYLQELQNNTYAENLADSSSLIPHWPV